MSPTWIGKWIERSLERNCDESLVVCLLEISRSLYVLRMFLSFKDLWWKFFGTLELESDETLMDQSLCSF